MFHVQLLCESPSYGITTICFCIPYLCSIFAWAWFGRRERPLQTDLMDFLHKSRAATLVQASWRGRVARQEYRGRQEEVNVPSYYNFVP